MIILVLMAVFICTLCVVLGILAALVAFAVMAILVTLGLVSASVLIGTWRKSFRKGFLFFLLSLGALAGGVVGLVLLSVSVKVFSIGLSWGQFLPIGLSGGVAGGLVTAFLVYWLTGRAVSFFRKKLRIA